MFLDRKEAGKKLAEKLKAFKGKDVIILAIPRGGVIVAAEVARTLNAPLDLVIPRKIGAPGNEELAIGAVVKENDYVLNEELIKSLQVTKEYLEDKIKKELLEIDRRRKIYLGEKSFPNLTGKEIIVVDDGIATGYTMLATIRAIRKHDPYSLNVAVPVAPMDSVSKIKLEADQVIILELPRIFYAVGQFYSEFSQTSDQEVISAINSLQNI